MLTDLTPFDLDISQHPAIERFVLLGHRSPEATIELVSELHFRGFRRYWPRDLTGDHRPETFCNVFTCDYAHGMRVTLPRLLANDLFRWLHAPESGGAAGWAQVLEAEAQRLANLGCPVVAVWRNPHPHKPGHIAPVVPNLGEPFTSCSNVGKRNLLRCRLVDAFGNVTPHFFANA
ncbi:MAG: hypothetical protein SFW67_28515 [Myxococcaceae bacterium]|nr:hypothetical protein [Myxococcaceae bacterium]